MSYLIGAGDATATFQQEQAKVDAQNAKRPPMFSPLTSALIAGTAVVCWFAWARKTVKGAR